MEPVNPAAPGMRRRLPFYLAAVLVSAGLAGVTHADPDWPAELGLDFWNLAYVQSMLERELLQQQRLEALDAMARRCLDLKYAIIDDLIHDRITLFQAAAEFIDLNRGRRELAAAFRTLYPGQCEAEASCRNVIDFVATTQQDEPDRQSALVARLTAELEHALASESGLKLP